MNTLLLRFRNGASLFMPGLIGLLATLMLSYPACVVGDDGAVVADGFEGAVHSKKWDTPVIHGSTIPKGSITFLDTDTYSGISSIQFNWFALNTSSIYLPIRLKGPDGKGIDELFLRFAVKWSDGFQFVPGKSAGKKIMRTFALGTHDDMAFLVRKTGSVASGIRFTFTVNRMYLHHRNPNLDENVGAPTVIETNKWYCFDWHIVGGMGKEGVVEGWINGIKKWDYHNIYTTSAPMTDFHLGGNISPDRPSIDQTEWFDNVSLSTAPIAPGDAAACTSNTSSPLTPTGLDVS
jgi:hypothetical protein